MFRSLTLQGWLVAAFVAVGMAASLAVLLVLLPALESSLRAEQGPREARSLELSLAQTGQRSPLPLFPTGQDVEDLATAIRADLGGEVRVVYRDRSGLVAAAPIVRDSPSQLQLLDALPIPAGGVAASGHAGRVVWATAPMLDDGRNFVGSITAARAVRGVSAELAIVRRRVFIAMLVVLSLASLLGFALSRVIGQRISGLAGTAAKLAGGDLSARAPALSPTELDTLSQSLNGMAARLESLVAEITSERDRDRAMLGSLAEGVVAVGPAGEVTVANEAAERYLGLARGADPVRLEALPAPLADAVRAAFADPERAESEHDLTLADGTELEVHVARLGTERAAGAVVTLRDVTEERRLERARRDLVANVSHELKTPIAALKGFLELLEGGDVSERHRREFIASMSQETARLERLVEEQLQLARLDSGALPLDRQPIDLGLLAADVVAPRAVLAERSGVELVCEPPPEPVVADADPVRVEQVLLILLDNALRHTPAGGRVVVAVGRAGGAATLAVRDDGSGIRPEEQPFVFDRFYRGDASREGRSAGLGLAIARGLARAHGGGIGLESELGSGSTFTLRLPLAGGANGRGAGAGGEEAGSGAGPEAPATAPSGSPSSGG